jgi:hypothetical protein
MRKMRGDLWGGLGVMGLGWALHHYSLPRQNLLLWKMICFLLRRSVVVVPVVVNLFVVCVPWRGGAGMVRVKTLWTRKNFNIQ